MLFDYKSSILIGRLSVRARLFRFNWCRSREHRCTQSLTTLNISIRLKKPQEQLKGLLCYRKTHLSSVRSFEWGQEVGPIFNTEVTKKLGIPMIHFYIDLHGAKVLDINLNFLQSKQWQYINTRAVKVYW